jgi:hypothetical protein
VRPNNLRDPVANQLVIGEPHVPGPYAPGDRSYVMNALRNSTVG